MNTRFFALALLAAASASHAATPVFSDDFNATPQGLNVTPAGWTVSSGTVDVIGHGFFDFIPGSGNYIDMDGSTWSAGTLSRQLSLAGGTSHTVTFQLAGNHNNTADEEVKVTFGTASGTYLLPQSAGWTNYSLSFTTGAAGNYTLSFAGKGGDNIGMLLDNVSVTAVPEPHTVALMLAGLAGIGLYGRRRSATQA